MSARDRRLLWQDVRLAVLDIETVHDPTGFSGPARDEADKAIEQVLATGKPVRLGPQPKRIRWFQHAAVEAAGLISMSFGEEPTRLVEIHPRPPGTPPMPPRQPATRENGESTSNGEDRLAWIAINFAEGGKPRDELWHSLVNPGVPVDAESASYHKLDDARLGRAPTFARIADTIVSLLTPADGEILIVVGHNIAFDLGVLRAEMRRIGQELPELPTLDTMTALAARVGRKSGQSLPDLCADLGLPGPKPWHTAPQDAAATARAACALLDMAADAGDFDMLTLLDALGSKTTVSEPGRRIGRAGKPERAARVVPTTHAARHIALPVGAAPRTITRWVAISDDCARLRCPDLAGDLSSTTARSVVALGKKGDPTPLLDALTEVAEHRAAKKDGPGVATALDAIALVYDLLCPVPLMPGAGGTPVGTPALRKAPQKSRKNYDTYRLGPATTVALWHRIRPLLIDLPHCSDTDGCPRCWQGDPCARDDLLRHLAPGGWGWGWENGRLPFIRSVANFLPARGTGGWFTHRRDGRNKGAVGPLMGPDLADATLAWLLRTFRVYGDLPANDRRISWEAGRIEKAGGCAEPSYWEMLALERAQPGRENDLREAIALCDKGLALRPADSTALGWRALSMTHELLTLRLTSLTQGPEIRHHPGSKAKRPRKLRFV